jgi:hypothetical protein
VQYDIYHAQRMEGELAATLQQRLWRIGHIQLADNPGRHEPGTGEINYAFCSASRQARLHGWVGCEYKPAGRPPKPVWAGARRLRWPNKPPPENHRRFVMSLNIGFIGLGIMGTPMAGHLIAGRSHRLFCTRAARCRRTHRAGATACASAQEVAQQADIVIIMLPDTPDVARCCLPRTAWPRA